MASSQLRETHRSCADVVVPVYGDVPLTRACIESVLNHSGMALSRLILVDDCGPDPGMRPMLRAFRDSDPRVHLIENARNLGFVGTANRGLALCEGHAVILNSDARVTPGWLAAMLGVLERSERIAAVSPLSNNGTLCSVPDFGESAPESVLGEQPLELASLPEWTEMPTGNGFCLLMRDTARATVGLFDPAFGRGYNEENDWCQRVRKIGLQVVRANRAFVFHRGEASFVGARSVLDLRNSQRLVARYPSYLAENRAFADGPEAHLAASAVRSRLDRLRVGLHPALRDATGLGGLTDLLSATTSFESVQWLDSSAPVARTDVVLAPLAHSTQASARLALAGTGRLISVLDAWRPVGHGWQRACWWAQLRASDEVWVPSPRAAAWLAELAPDVTAQVVSWPHEALVRQGTHDAPVSCALMVEPTAAIRALATEALAQLDPPLTLQVLPVGAPGLGEALRSAAVLLDFGGTPAGVLTEAWSLGVPVFYGLLSVADALPVPHALLVETLSPRALARSLGALASRTVTPLALPPSPDAVARAWGARMSAVAAAPDGRIAEARAALQVLLALD